MITFEEYKVYVTRRVVPENPYEYTIMRAALEFCEEYMEFCLEPSYDELGDMIFWFAYFSQIARYELTNPILPDGLLLHNIKDLAGCVKRYFRDEVNPIGLMPLGAKILPSIEYHIRATLQEFWQEESLEELMQYNIEKLDDRLGPLPSLL